MNGRFREAAPRRSPRGPTAGPGRTRRVRPCCTANAPKINAVNLGSNWSCGAAAITSPKCSGLPGTDGPEPPFSRWPIAGAQLHQTGHSSIARHSRRMKVERVEIPAVGDSTSDRRHGFSLRPDKYGKSRREAARTDFAEQAPRLVSPPAHQSRSRTCNSISTSRPGPASAATPTPVSDGVAPLKKALSCATQMPNRTSSRSTT